MDRHGPDLHHSAAVLAEPRQNGLHPQAVPNILRWAGEEEEFPVRKTYGNLPFFCT